ncbi:hypothetical protein RRG08_050587 [Elysia crispata]|uniref:Uncharacterized protein n=1 Tax=Elysia crispata TaxID=231223 RepID=A0AAE0Z7V9_9GAST|nr:hypothetical protein RRG08_050587 [Elysia crispata]
MSQFSVISETLVISNCRASDCDRHQTSDFIKSSGKCSDSEPNGHCLELGIYTETDSPTLSIAISAGSAAPGIMGNLTTRDFLSDNQLALPLDAFPCLFENCTSGPAPLAYPVSRAPTGAPSGGSDWGLRLGAPTRAPTGAPTGGPDTPCFSIETFSWRLINITPSHIQDIIIADLARASQPNNALDSMFERLPCLAQMVVSHANHPSSGAGLVFLLQHSD